MGDGGKGRGPKTQRADPTEVVALVNDLQSALKGIATKTEMAQAVGMAPANLTRALGGDSTPRDATVRSLVHAADEMLDRHGAHLDPDVRAELEDRLGRLDVTSTTARAPTQLVGPGGFLPSSAQIYVRRPVDDEMGRKLEAGQSFEIIGPPASGRSSLCAHAALIARELGDDVVTVALAPTASPADDHMTVLQAVRLLVDSVATKAFPLGDAPRSLTVSDGATVSELLSTFAAAIHAWCAADREGRPVLLVDGLNLLPAHAGDALESALRSRTQGDLGARSLVYVLSDSSPVASERAKGQPIYVSTADTAVVEAGWFSGPGEATSLAGDGARPRVLGASDLDHLSVCYQQAAPSQLRPWVIEMVTEAWQLFAGQPRLTHQYLHDHARHGVDRSERVARVWDVRSPYRSHLRLLEAAAPGPDGSRTSDTITVVPPAGTPPVGFVPSDLPPAAYLRQDIRSLKELGLIDGADTPWSTEYRWRSWYYAAHFAREAAGDA